MKEIRGKDRITFDRKRTLVTLACFAVMAVFWVIPPVEPISAVGMRTVGVFLGTVLLLSLVDTTWPAILCIPLFALTGVMTMNEAIMGSLGNWITMFVIMSFILTHALNTTGFTTRLTALYMGSRWVSRSPWVFTIALVFLGMIVGWFLDPVPTVAFFMTFSNKIFRELGYEPGERYSQMVVMALAFAINIAGAMTPISHPLALLGMGIYQNTTGNSISLFDYMAFGMPLGLMLFLALILIMRFIIRPDMSKFDDFDVEKILDDVRPMGLREKITVITFFAVVIAWVLPGILNILDPGNPLAQAMNRLGPAFPPLIAVVIMAVVRVDDRPVIDLKDAFSHGMNWGVIFLVAAAILLGGALTKEGVGFSDFVITRVMPSIAGSPELFMVLALAFATSLMTNFTSNVTTITLMTGVALSLTVGGQNIHPAAITLITTFVGACAYMVPASFASIGVLYGNEYNNGSMTFRYGGLMVIVTTLVSTFLGYGLARLLLG